MLIHLGNQNESFPMAGLKAGTMDGTLYVLSTHTFPREEYEFDANGMIEYAFFNADADATTTATDWIGVKSVYINTTQLIRRQIKIGAFSNRAALFSI